MGEFEVNIRCLCGNLNEIVQLSPVVPWDNLTCNCNPCRHVSGAISYGGIAILNAPEEVFCSKMVKYATTKRISRYFCATCGSSALYYNTQQGNWAVCPGAIEEVKRGDQAMLERAAPQEFIGDTIDGGFSWCYPTTKLYREGVGEPPVEDIKTALADSKTQYETSIDETKLLAQCHCGRVQLYISRPDEG